MYLRIALKIMQPSWANSSLPSNDLPMMIMMMMIAAMIIWLRLEIWGYDKCQLQPIFPFGTQNAVAKKSTTLVSHSFPSNSMLVIFYQMSGLQHKWLLQSGQVALSATCNLQGNLLPDLPLFFCHNPTRWRLIRMDWSVSTTFLAKVTQTNENEKQCWVGLT